MDRRRPRPFRVRRTPSVRTVSALAVAAALVAVVWPGPALARDRPERPREPVEQYAAATAAPAVATATVAPGGAVTTVVHGATSDGVPVTGATPFRIASMSKAFTAVAVLQLHDQGRLDLDDPVAAVLPGFAVADPRGSRITVRQLLAHTSGLAAPDVDEFALPPARSTDDVLRGLHDTRLARDPGTTHEYLNTHYVVAAAVVEHVTGRPFDEHLRDAVLLPLGMTATVATDRCDAAVPGLARGHVGALGVQVPAPELPAFCAGDGGVVSTVADMTRWLRFQLGDGAPLLAPATFAASHEAAPGTDGRYGLAWSVRTAPDGRPRILHGGALTTWSSAIELAPTGAGAVVLTDAAGTPGDLARRLVDVADGREPSDPAPSDPLDVVNLALVGATVVAAVLGAAGMARAGRRARRMGGRRRVLSLPVVGMAAGLAALPVTWALVMGPSATAWVMVVWLVPLAGVLAAVLVGGGAVVLPARRRAARRHRSLR